MSSYMKFQNLDNSICSNPGHSYKLNVQCSQLDLQPWTPTRTGTKQMSRNELTTLLSKSVDIFLSMDDSVLLSITSAWNHWPLLLNLISDNQLSTPLPLRPHLRPPSPPLPLCLIHFRRVQFRRIVNQEYHHLVRTLTGGCGDQVIRAVKTETVLLHKAWREDRHSMATVILKNTLQSETLASSKTVQGSQGVTLAARLLLPLSHRNTEYSE